MQATTIISWIEAPWFGASIGIISLIAAVYFYLKSKQTSKISLQIDEISLFGGYRSEFPENIKIHFDEKSVHRLTRTRVVLWNNGSTTINGQQIVRNDPLRFEISQDCSFVKFEILRETRAVNGISLSQTEQNCVGVSFDFLDAQDGVTLEFYHSAPTKNLSLLGTIRGIPSGINNCGRIDSWRLGRNPKIKSYMLAYSIFLVVSGLFIATMPSSMRFITIEFPALREEYLLSNPIYDWVFAVIGMIYIFPLFSMLRRFKRKFPASLEIEGAPSRDVQNNPSV